MFYISDREHSLLAGCPPEIVKVLMQRGLKSPHHILLPDQPVSHGESQVAVEFPLYHHLFFGGKLAVGEPLGIIGSTRPCLSLRWKERISRVSSSAWAAGISHSAICRASGPKSVSSSNARAAWRRRALPM
ncbi:MAG: hypothetical protein ACKODH_18075, partial [Limisphaerales bacterium]